MHMITEWTMSPTSSSCSGMSFSLFSLSSHDSHLHNINILSHSIAFLLYSHAVFLVHLYTTSGRNSPSSSSSSPGAKEEGTGAIELTSPTGAGNGRGGRWYARVPATLAREEEEESAMQRAALMGGVHVVGEDEDE